MEAEGAGWMKKAKTQRQKMGRHVAEEGGSVMEEIFFTFLVHKRAREKGERERAEKVEEGCLKKVVRGDIGCDKGGTSREKAGAEEGDGIRKKYLLPPCKREGREREREGERENGREREWERERAGERERERESGRESRRERGRERERETEREWMGMREREKFYWLKVDETRP